MSTQNRSPEPPPLAERLGYLLKHAQLRFFELSASAFASLGISGQEGAVLRAIDGPDPLSQGDVARRMRIDRTTMVALIDDLERKGLAQRRQDLQDRRKNVVELTGAGRDTLRRANQAAGEAERIFLSPLPADERERFMTALRVLLSGERAELSLVRRDPDICPAGWRGRPVVAHRIQADARSPRRQAGSVYVRARRATA